MADQGKVLCPMCGAVAKRDGFGNDWRNRKMQALSPLVRTGVQAERALRANRIKRQNEKAQ